MFSIVENYADDLKVYYKMIELFEKRKFKSLHTLRKLKTGLRIIKD
jgi:hypothetical protein